MEGLFLFSFPSEVLAPSVPAGLAAPGALFRFRDVFCLDFCDVHGGSVSRQQPGPLSPSTAISMQQTLMTQPRLPCRPTAGHAQVGSSSYGHRSGGPCTVLAHEHSEVPCVSYPLSCTSSSVPLCLKPLHLKSFFSLKRPCSPSHSLSLLDSPLPHPLGHMQETGPGGAAGPEPAGPGGPDGHSPEGPGGEGGFV